MNPLDHWKQDHISNVLTDGQVRDRVAVLTPTAPCVCGVCRWPGGFTDMCSVCTSLAQAVIISRDRTYWRELDARERMAAQQQQSSAQGGSTI